MYGVIALFDERTEKQIQRLWNELYDRNLSHYSKAVEDRRPHITLAAYRNLKKALFIRQMDEFLNATNRMPVTLGTLGTFLPSRTVFLSPTPTKALLDWHHRYHERFKRYNDNPSSLYLLGKWIPHCTIANHLSKEQYRGTFEYCAEHFQTLHAYIEEVALIELEYDGDRCVRAPILFSKRLGNVHRAP